MNNKNEIMNVTADWLKNPQMRKMWERETHILFV
jgi:hypothetical protein